MYCNTRGSLALEGERERERGGGGCAYIVFLFHLVLL